MATLKDIKDKFYKFTHHHPNIWQGSLRAHSVQGKNNRLAHKIESLKTTINSFYDDTSMTDGEKEKLIQDRIWKPSMVIS